MLPRLSGAKEDVVSLGDPICADIADATAKDPGQFALEHTAHGWQLVVPGDPVEDNALFELSNGTTIRAREIECSYEVTQLTNIAAGERTEVVVQVLATQTMCLQQRFDVVANPKQNGDKVGVFGMRWLDYPTKSGGLTTRHAALNLGAPLGSGKAATHGLELRTFNADGVSPAKSTSFSIQADPGLAKTELIHRARLRRIRTRTKSAVADAINVVETPLASTEWTVRVEARGINQLETKRPAAYARTRFYAEEDSAGSKATLTATRVKTSIEDRALESVDLPRTLLGQSLDPGSITIEDAISIKTYWRPIDLRSRTSLVCTQRHVDVGDKHDPLTAASQVLAYTKTRALRRREYASCELQVYFGDLFDEPRYYESMCTMLRGTDGKPGGSWNSLGCGGPAPNDREKVKRMRHLCASKPHRCYQHVIAQVGAQQLELTVEVQNEGDTAEQIKTDEIPLPVLERGTPIDPESGPVVFREGRVILDIGSDLHGAVVTHTSRKKYARVSVKLAHVSKSGDASVMNDAVVHPAWSTRLETSYTIATRVMPRIAVWRWHAWRPTKLRRSELLARSRRDLGGRVFLSFLGNFSAFRWPGSGRDATTSSEARRFELAEFDYGVGVTFENWDLGDNEPLWRINPQLQVLMFLPKDFSGRENAVRDISYGAGLGLRLPIGTEKGAAFAAGTSLGIWYETGPSGRGGRTGERFHSLLVGGSLLVGRILEGR